MSLRMGVYILFHPVEEDRLKIDLYSFPLKVCAFENIVVQSLNLVPETLMLIHRIRALWNAREPQDN